MTGKESSQFPLSKVGARKESKEILKYGSCNGIAVLKVVYLNSP
jgi:hypothetical protein